MNHNSNPNRQLISFVLANHEPPQLLSGGQPPNRPETGRRVPAIRRFPFWPLVVAVLAAWLPYPELWVSIALAYWAYRVYKYFRPTRGRLEQTPKEGNARVGARSPVLLPGTPAPFPRRPETIPPPPVQRAPPMPRGGTPSRADVSGAFSVIARKYAAYRGEPRVPFVPFQAYYSKYADMNPAQLRFYFSWRQAVRDGQTPETSLSYIFVLVYELLHVIGADTAHDAAQQLERLWLAYRPSFPKLDHYLVRWIADLYATDGDVAGALTFIFRAVLLGAAAGNDELSLVTDAYWQKGDYAAMPLPCIGMLTADYKLSENKFYCQCNTDGWVDRAYRDALAAADRAYQTTNGHTLRDAAIADDGLRPVQRVAFGGAVYEWKPKQVTFGKVPVLLPTSAVVQVERNTIRYTENVLRTERDFGAKRRGVKLAPEIAQALDDRLAVYVRSTRARPSITINYARATDLERESESVRARLLAGLPDTDSGATNNSVERAPDLAQTESRDVAMAPASGPGALLTQLSAARVVLDGVSDHARALLGALIDLRWEAPEASTAIATAVQDVLVSPLVDEINDRAMPVLHEALIVREGDLIVVQEDLRDEVYQLLRGTLDGFNRKTHSQVDAVRPAGPHDERPDVDGFGPLELEALAILGSGESVPAHLATLSLRAATSPLLLLDRVNELGLASSYGDLLVDIGADPPMLYQDCRAYVTNLLEHAGPTAQHAE
jgi:hypothetical protein